MTDLLYYANPSSSTPQIAAAMNAGMLGCIVTPKAQSPTPDRAVIAADNGVYGAGWPGEDAWWAWLQTLPTDRCAFAVAPDVVGDAAATAARSAPWLPRIRGGLGVPAAFVAQDGLTPKTTRWDDFDVLFLGGTTAFKLGAVARQLVVEARARGKPVHMGRVNSHRRLRYAHGIGCASADGTYLTFGPAVNLPKLLGWCHEVNNQHPLIGV